MPNKFDRDWLQARLQSNANRDQRRYDRVSERVARQRKALAAIREVVAAQGEEIENIRRFLASVFPNQVELKKSEEIRMDSLP